MPWVLQIQQSPRYGAQNARGCTRLRTECYGLAIIPQIEKVGLHVVEPHEK